MDAVMNHQTADWLTDRTVQRLGLVGRLKPGVTRQQAQADMRLLSKQLAEAYPKTDRDRKAVLTRMTMLPPDALPPSEDYFSHPTRRGCVGPVRGLFQCGKSSAGPGQRAPPRNPGPRSNGCDAYAAHRRSDA